MFELGRQLDPVAVGVADHEEQVVARPVPARPPPHGNAHGGQMIAPVADVVPAAGLEGEVIEAGGIGAERRVAVVLLVGAEEHRGQAAVVVEHPVGFDEAQRAAIEIDDGVDVGGGEDDVLQSAGQHVGIGRMLGGRHTEHQCLAIRVGDRKGGVAEQRAGIGVDGDAGIGKPLL